MCVMGRPIKQYDVEPVEEEETWEPLLAPVPEEVPA